MFDNLKRIVKYFYNHNIIDFFDLITRPILYYIKSKENKKIIEKINRCNSFPKLSDGDRVIVSLTTFPRRYNEAVLSIKSLLLQEKLPDKIVLYLGDDCDLKLPENLLELKKYGVVIKTGYRNIKPHKKYYFAMQEYPNSIIITVDDDLVYDKYLISDLLKSYKRNPNIVSATRVHRILVKNNKVLPYRKWDYEYCSLLRPSHQLLSTNGAGTLFPPHVLPEETFNIENILKYALNADDIWLKFMLLKNDIPVVLCNRRRLVLEPLVSAQTEALSMLNVEQNQNDTVIKLLQNHYNLYLANYGYKLK